MSFVDYVRWVRMAKARTIPVKIPPAGGEKWRSAAAMPIATILAVCSGAAWPDAGELAHAFSDSQNVISAFNRSRILCGVVAANSDSRNVLLTSFRASWEKDLHVINPFRSAERQHDHQLDVAQIRLPVNRLVQQVMLMLEWRIHCDLV